MENEVNYDIVIFYLYDDKNKLNHFMFFDPNLVYWNYYKYQDDDLCNIFEYLLIQLVNLRNKFIIYTYSNYPVKILNKHKLIVNEFGFNLNILKKRTPDYNEDLILKFIKEDNRHFLKLIKNENFFFLFNSLIDNIDTRITDNLINKINFKKIEMNKYMRIDHNALTGLNIFNFKDENDDFTIYSFLNHCKTRMGKEYLKFILLNPLKDLKKIEKRQRIVSILVEEIDLYNKLEIILIKTPDLNRIINKLYKYKIYKKNNFEIVDMFRINNLFDDIYDFYLYLNNYFKEENYLKNKLWKYIKKICNLKEFLYYILDYDNSNKHNYYLKSNFDQSILKVSNNIKESVQKIENLAKKFEDNYGVKIKINNNSLNYGYLFETKKDSRNKIKEEIKIVTTKKSTITFTFNELNVLSRFITDCKEEYEELQNNWIFKCLDYIINFIFDIENLNNLICKLDVFYSFAKVIKLYNFSKPKLYEYDEEKNNNNIKIKNAFHPLLEANKMKNENIIKNDSVLEKNNTFFYLITGPNMGGKSTYIRTIALCVYLAQIGCYVPAESLNMSIIDNILVRMGATDCLGKGISTFMNEMLDCSSLLEYVNNKSLVVMDEIGRGTSNSEGIGISCSITEHLVKNIKCFGLFATHFKELGKLESEIPGISNYHFPIIYKDNERFKSQFKLEKGISESSLGFKIMEILDFPQEIIEQTHKLLKTNV